MSTTTTRPPPATRDYTRGSLLQSIWWLALPMTLEMTIGDLLRIAELYFVGRVWLLCLEAGALAGS